MDAISEQRLALLYQELLDGKKGIIVAHKFNNLIRSVNRIIVLEHGEITGNGPHEELIKSNEKYQKLYEIKVQ